jgi:hypothetical protein
VALLLHKKPPGSLVRITLSRTERSVCCSGQPVMGTITNNQAILL